MKHTSLTVLRRDPAKHQTVPQALNIENGGGISEVQVFFSGTDIKSLDLRAGQTDLR
jgi:hypothetical protein